MPSGPGETVMLREWLGRELPHRGFGGWVRVWVCGLLLKVPGDAFGFYHSMVWRLSHQVLSRDTASHTADTGIAIT